MTVSVGNQKMRAAWSDLTEQFSVIDFTELGQ